MKNFILFIMFLPVLSYANDKSIDMWVKNLLSIVRGVYNKENKQYKRCAIYFANNDEIVAEFVNNIADGLFGEKNKKHLDNVKVQLIELKNYDKDTLNHIISYLNDVKVNNREEYSIIHLNNFDTLFAQADHEECLQKFLHILKIINSEKSTFGIYIIATSNKEEKLPKDFLNKISMYCNIYKL